MQINEQNTLLLFTNNCVERINIHTILRIEALSNYSKVYFVEGKTLVVAKTLNWFEKSLTSLIFIRVHRKHLININCIVQYNFDQSSMIELTDSSMVQLARRRRKSFTKMWNEKSVA